MDKTRIQSTYITINISNTIDLTTTKPLGLCANKCLF